MKSVAKAPGSSTPRRPTATVVAAAGLLLLLVAYGVVRWRHSSTTSGEFSRASGDDRSSPASASVPRVDRLEALDPAVAAAIRDAIAAVEREPSSGARWGELGIVYNAHRYYALADGCYARAAELDRTVADWPHLRGVLAEERGDVEAAAAFYAAALERMPSDQAARYRLGNVLLQAGRMEQAERAYGELATAAPEQPWGAIGLGRVALRRGSNEEAVQRFERALAVDPANDQAAFLLAGAYRAQGNTAQARRLAERSRDGVRPGAPADPIVDRVRGGLRSLQSRVNAANRLLAAGNVDGATEIYASVLAIDPEHYDALYDLALVYGRQERFGEAQQLLERAIVVRPESSEARLLLALALASQDRLQDAREQLHQLLERDPDHVEAKRMLDQLGS
jgi:tetratricopeptide (TPR) repeat protein